MASAGTISTLPQLLQLPAPEIKAHPWAGGHGGSASPEIFNFLLPSLPGNPPTPSVILIIKPKTSRACNRKQ